MKPKNGKRNGEKTATWVLAAVLAMTTVGSALPASAPAQPGADAPDLATATAPWVLVSIPDRKLALFENGRVVRIYRVAVGKISTPSPVGEFKIVNRVTNPTYYHKGQIIAAGKGNPVGTRWMGLSAKGYGIHGTNQPASIGKAVSTGCIRMGRKDLEEIFTIVDVGDTVQIRAERDDQIAAVFGSGTDAPTDAATMAQVESEKDAHNGQ
jgi:lipoprotein-anchoring transpeptidase ErfK/SrfK